jgi:hypothetical protein
MAKNAQQRSRGPPQSWPSIPAITVMVVDFLDQQRGIATA